MNKKEIIQEFVDMLYESNLLLLTKPLRLVKDNESNDISYNHKKFSKILIKLEQQNLNYLIYLLNEKLKKNKSKLQFRMQPNREKYDDEYAKIEYVNIGNFPMTYKYTQESLSTIPEIIEKLYCEKDTKLVFQKFLGSGAFGSAFRVCLDTPSGKCNYVLKISGVPHAYLITYNNYVKQFGFLYEEIENNRKASDLGLSPKFVDAWICDDKDKLPPELLEKIGLLGKGGPYVFILMEEANGVTMKQYLDELEKKDITEEERQQIFESLCDQFQDFVINMYDTMNVIHEDMHEDNIFVEDLGHNLYNFQLIDWAMAKFYDGPIPDDIKLKNYNNWMKLIKCISDEEE